MTVKRTQLLYYMFFVQLSLSGLAGRKTSVYLLTYLLTHVLVRTAGAWSRLVGHCQRSGHQDGGSVQELLLQLQEEAQPGGHLAGTQGKGERRSVS